MINERLEDFVNRVREAKMSFEGDDVDAATTPNRPATASEAVMTVDIVQATVRVHLCWANNIVVDLITTQTTCCLQITVARKCNIPTLKFLGYHQHLMAAAKILNYGLREWTLCRQFMGFPTLLCSS